MSVQSTGISWCDSVWNPLRGCSRVSTGCEHCYAESQAGRFSGPGQPYEGLVRKTSQGFKWTGEVRLIEKDLEVPLRWKKPRRIFVNSMSDLFHESVPDEWIDTIYAVMLCADALALGHTFQILTKRPQRMQAYFAAAPWPRVSAIAKARWNWHFGAGSKWYPGNVWLGVSVEDQATADERIPWLLKTPAAVRFVSYEPALGAVDFTNLRTPDGYLNALTGLYASKDAMTTPLDWIICGGESGPKARPCDMAWLWSTVQQCQATGTACWVKQLGTKPYEVSEFDRTYPFPLTDHKGADPAEWPADLRIQQFPMPPQGGRA